MLEMYMRVLTRYLRFTGRAGRKEFWSFALVSTIVFLIFSRLSATDMNPTGLYVDRQNGFDPDGWEYVSFIFTFHYVGTWGIWYLIGTVVPSVAVGVRRLQDTSRSGGWQMLMFLPILGWVALLVLYALPGTPGVNQYGPDPETENQVRTEPEHPWRP